MRTIKELQRLAHKTAVEKGFWDSDRSFGALIALLHSELSEALEAYRKRGFAFWHESNKPCGVESELADLFIRLLDLCEFYGIDLQARTEEKMLYNKTRDYRHGDLKEV